MKRPFLNLLSLLSGDLGSRLIGFVISVYLARVLEPTGFGLMSVGLSVLGYLQLAGSPGIQILETRNAAASAEIDHTRVGAVLSLRLVLAVVLWILTACCVFLFVPDGGTGYVILLFALSLFPFALTLDWFFQGREMFLAVGTSRLLQSVTYGVVVFLLVHNSDDIHRTAVAFVLSAFVAAAALWWAYAAQWGGISLSWSPAKWKEILAMGIPVGGAVFLAQSVTNLPPLVIGYFSSTMEVGLFSSAMKLVFLLLMIDRLFNALFLPVITRCVSRRSEETSMLVGTTLRIMLAMIIPLTVAGIILSRIAMTTFFGGRYEEASPLLEILMCYFALTAVNSVFVCILLASHREKEYTRTLVQGSIVLCIAVAAGAAWLGARGAAYGVVLGEMVTMGLMMKTSRKLLSVPLIRIVVRPLVAGGCMAAAAYVLRETGLVSVIAVSLLVFFIVQILVKGITTREIQFLRERFV